MVALKEVDIRNFSEIVSLQRDSFLQVGEPEYVLAEAYVYRNDCTAYGIYSGDTAVGLVILRDRPAEGAPYSFTDIFIADNFQRRGYGQAAVEAIMQKFRSERLRGEVEIQVHEGNVPALKIYRRCGFEEVKRAEWNSSFLVMRAKL